MKKLPLEGLALVIKSNQLDVTLVPYSCYADKSIIIITIKIVALYIVFYLGSLI